LARSLLYVWCLQLIAGEHTQQLQHFANFSLLHFDFLKDLIMKFTRTALVIAALAATAFAHASDTAQLELSGKVAVNCTLAVKPTAKASSLDIINGERSTVVGQVTESCNSGNGYTVSISSGNAGQLLSKATGAVPTAYQAGYDDGTGSIDKSIVADRNAARFGHEGSLWVTFAGNSKAVAGQYNDIINLVIAAK
jgi:hypothetical protein